MDDDAAARLSEGLAQVLGSGDVHSAVQLSGGASRSTWRAVADGRPLVVQLQRAGDERDMGTEAAVLRAAAAAGVPVAELVASGVGDTPLGGSFLVLAAVEGESIARRILRDPGFARAREVLPTQLGAAAARLHTIDPGVVPGLTADDQVQRYREVLDTLAEPHPTFELAFRWLENRRPAPSSAELCVVHGDFRLGNVIVGEDGLRAVLDWELAHLGDPMEDLGWLCVKAWRFGGRGPVAGLGAYEQLFEAYEAAGGRSVDPETVRWWEVLGTLKWGIMCILQASVHLNGTTRSHELAAIGRRVCENEHDLFLALEGRW